MRKYTGSFAPAALPVTVSVPNAFGRALKVRKMMDYYNDVTVMAVLSEKPVNEETGNPSSVTISIAVASAQQLRRITGFNEMGAKLKALKPGTVISCYGETLYSNNQTGQNNANINGMNVAEVKVIHEPEVETQPETAALSEGNQQADIQ